MLNAAVTEHLERILWGLFRMQVNITGGDVHRLQSGLGAGQLVEEGSGINRSECLDEFRTI